MLALTKKLALDFYDLATAVVQTEHDAHVNSAHVADSECAPYVHDAKAIQ